MCVSQQCGRTVVWPGPEGVYSWKKSPCSKDHLLAGRSINLICDPLLSIVSHVISKSQFSVDMIIVVCFQCTSRTLTMPSTASSIFVLPWWTWTHSSPHPQPPRRWWTMPSVMNSHRSMRETGPMSSQLETMIFNSVVCSDFLFSLNLLIIWYSWHSYLIKSLCT